MESNTPALVSIIMGSASDLPVMEKAAAVLEELSVPYEMTVVSAHRTPERMMDHAQNARGCWSALQTRHAA